MERLNQSGIFFLTVCAPRRKRIFAQPDVSDLLQDVWSRATSWMVGRYVIMPDHVHLFCVPGESPAPELARWVRYWKSLASRRWPRASEQPVWHLDFWDTQLRCEEHYAEKWAYVRENPVRAGLAPVAEEWPYQGELHELRM